MGSEDLMRGTSKLTVAAVVLVVVLVACWEVVPRACAQQEGARVRRRGAASIDAALSDPVEKQMSRLRDGAVLTNELGTFVTLGDRTAFKPDNEEYAFSVLENLAVERVWKMLDNTRGRQWLVSGFVTEYRGRNYLLLHRAVLRARSNSTSTANP